MQGALCTVLVTDIPQLTTSCRCMFASIRSAIAFAQSGCCACGVFVGCGLGLASCKLEANRAASTALGFSPVLAQCSLKAAASSASTRKERVSVGLAMLICRILFARFAVRVFRLGAALGAALCCGLGAGALGRRRLKAVCSMCLRLLHTVNFANKKGPNGGLSASFFVLRSIFFCPVCGVVVSCQIAAYGATFQHHLSFLVCTHVPNRHILCL